MSRYLRFAFGLLLVFTACSRKLNVPADFPYPLASVTENRVHVEIALVWDESGQTWLEALFTPEEGYHLYSKDLPPGGIDGVGRPTLLELLPGSRMEAGGELTESVESIPDEELDGLRYYPEGPVTLRLPVHLPEGQGWFDEQVSVTYMACHTGTCCPPVMNKLIPVSVPGAEEAMIP